jgi:lipopolysaccharide transport system ATP-binding protein
MTGTAISIQNISKKYLIGHQRHDTLRDQLSSLFKDRLGAKGSNHTSDLWALRQVNMDVEQGEVVGIIGRNGAGKSTLLKILSRITEPTTGRVELFGRVGSLLEVGTGFHPELTGRENIYMNGAILGMTRKEIETKYDQILEFADIEKFIDTPVKRYSSGMYVRLAFAVAAHLEPEILLVDEVLAVGDVAFQRKCLGKMNDIASTGRTVIFVSHNMSAVQTLCKRGIYLDEGRVAYDGQIDRVVSYYLSTLEQSVTTTLADRQDRSGRGNFRLNDVEISSPGEWNSKTLATGQPARIKFIISEARPGMVCSFTIYDQKGQHVSFFRSSLTSPDDTIDKSLNNEFICDIDALPLLPGQYRIDFGLSYNEIYEDRLEAVAYFIVDHGQFQGRQVLDTNQYGSVVIPHRWILPRS